MASTNSENPTNSCRSSSCGCEPQVSRRDVLQILGVGATASALPIGAQVMAGPFAAEDVADHLIPADKKLTPEWVASLTKRGQAEVFSGEQLKYVGMPIGGIGCGQLYLVGGLFAAFQLAPGESRTVNFAVTWYFPDYHEIDAAPGTQASKPVVTLDGRDIDAQFQKDGARTIIRFPKGFDVAAGQTLPVQNG